MISCTKTEILVRFFAYSSHLVIANVHVSTLMETTLELVADITRLPEDKDTGYILAVDLEYSPGLHQSHNDYPLAAERLSSQEILSPVQLALIDKL